MMMYAVLSNPNHPKYGVATIPFPIPRDQYTYCMDLLEALEVGDTVKADCKVVEFDSVYTVLKHMKALTVNVEELNYLVKRLESFDTGEAAQFQAMAHKLELFELKDLINLTFCCQQATVITDFSDLAAVGRDHCTEAVPKQRNWMRWTAREPHGSSSKTAAARSPPTAWFTTTA